MLPDRRPGPGIDNADSLSGQRLANPNHPRRLVGSVVGRVPTPRPSPPATVADGNAILGHILGSKDVSRSVAAQASQQTGIGSDLLKQMLPVVATMAMGYLSKQTASGNVQQEGLLGMLTPMLDSNRDGSVMDDVLGMASRFFQK